MKLARNILVLITLVLSSCSYYNTRYLQYYDPEEKYEQNQIADKMYLKNNYVIREGDELRLSIYTLTNGDLDFINGTSGGSGVGGGVRVSVPYRVKLDGTIELPKIGPVLIRGFTIEEAEEIITQKFEGYLENPVARIDVQSFSVTVIGEDGSGLRIPMENGTLTILEAVAQSSVIEGTSRTKNVKIIRQTGFKNQIYEVDLTDVNLIYSPNYYLYPNDIVYLEPTFMGNFRLSNIQQIIGFLSAAIVIYTFIAPK